MSDWIEGLKEGDTQAAHQVWQRFYCKLINLARKCLKNTSRRVSDEDDVVTAALHACFTMIQEGRYPEINDRHDLWKLFFRVTESKAVDQMRYLNRQKRGGKLTINSSAVQGGIEQIVGGEPTPEFALIFSEELERLLKRVSGAATQSGVQSQELQLIVQMKIAGYSHQEIADRIQRSLATVERRLFLIRELLVEEED